MMENDKTLPQKTLAAGVGMHVEIDLVSSDGTERLAFEIVTDKNADFQNGFLGTSTPLARAIQGRKAGQSVPYRVGGAQEVRLIRVEPSTTPPTGDADARRQETLRKAVEQSDRTNAMIFASSFSGKWGDYDPTGFTEPMGEAQDKDEKSGGKHDPGPA